MNVIEETIFLDKLSSRQFNWPFAYLIGLITVLEAILTSRQPHEKLQCLYENLMPSNFLKRLSSKKKKM